MSMQSFVSIIHHSVCAFIALTHKKIAFALLIEANLTPTNNSLLYLQITVLALTGVGALLRIYIDWKNRNK